MYRVWEWGRSLKRLDSRSVQSVGVGEVPAETGQQEQGYKIHYGPLWPVSDLKMEPF